MTPPAQTETRRLLCLEAIRLLCRIFWGPDPDLCRDIVDGHLETWLGAFTDTFRIDPEDPPMPSLHPDIRFSDADALHAALSTAYTSLFINDANGVSVPLYESCHDTADGRLMGPSAVEMNDRLERHGLTVSLPANEPADHLCIELEYIYYLLTRGWDESDDAMLGEAAAFSRRILNGWIPRFNERIVSDGRYPFYMMAGRLLCRTLSVVADRTEMRW